MPPQWNDQVAYPCQSGNWYTEISFLVAMCINGT